MNQLQAMSNENALNVMKAFVDQALGQGLFKNIENVNLAQKALATLGVAVEERASYYKQIQADNKLPAGSGDPSHTT